MINIINDSYHEKGAPYVWLIALILFLTPISIVIGDDGVSVNYTFAILLFIAPWGYRSSITGMGYCSVLALSYPVGMLIFSQGSESFLTRQFISFIVALLPVLILFIKLNISIRTISIAVILTSLLYSLWVIWAVCTHDFSLADVYFIKGGLREYVSDWPQRYVSILILGFFLSINFVKQSYIYVVSAIILFGVIFLTFTRAAYLALIVGALGYFISSCYFYPKIFFKKSRLVENILRKLPYFFLLSIIIICLANEDIQKAITLIFNATINNVGEALTGNLDKESSAGERFNIWEKAFGFVLEKNPLLGTGLAGLGLFNVGAGSAHSQYMDIFIRTGILGLIAYLVIFFIFLSRAFRVYPPLFAWLISLSIFGFFHETTKLSYVAFAYFIFFNLVSERLSLKSRPLAENILLKKKGTVL
ncbi:MAG: O-antigen ligase family protein [Pseudomonadota bacterium]